MLGTANHGHCRILEAECLRFLAPVTIQVVRERIHRADGPFPTESENSLLHQVRNRRTFTNFWRQKCEMRSEVLIEKIDALETVLTLQKEEL